MREKHNHPLDHILRRKYFKGFRDGRCVYDKPCTLVSLKESIKLFYQSEKKKQKCF